jgi:hypothetical protein
MGSLIATIGSYVSLGLLGFGGIAHLRAIQHFAFTIELQTGLGQLHARVVAGVVSATEVLLAAVGFGSVMVDARGPLRITMVLVAALYGAYAIYSSFLITRRPGVPCGCSSDDIPTTIWVVVRAGALAIAAGAVALAPGEVLAWTPSTHFSMAALSAATFSLLLWNLPSALHSAVGEAPEAT